MALETHRSHIHEAGPAGETGCQGNVESQKPADEKYFNEKREGSSK